MLLDTPICDFGWQAAEFTLKDTEGHSHTMSDYLDGEALLIMFICNHCPYVQRIAAQLAEDTKLLISEDISVLAVMSNDYHLVEADSPKNMKVFSKQAGFAFPYLIDEEQTVGKKYNAICTPDFFGFNKRGELQYRGRLDDSTAQNLPERTPELVNAMRQIAKTGHGPKDQMPSMGCSIKWR